MLTIYNIIIYIYRFLIRVASPFNLKARQWLNGRKGIWARLDEISKKDGNCIWVHCSSLGEFEQGRPVIENLRESYPGYKILITFFSPSGYEVRKNFTKADYVDYLPLDTRRNAEKFLDLVKPSMALFIKYEFWYHYLNQLSRKSIPHFLISANFRSGQVFFKWYGSWYRKMLQGFTGIFVQNEKSGDLLQAIGITSMQVTGDTRFDRVKAISLRSKEIPLAYSFGKEKFVLVAGSTWDKDEQLLVELFRKSPFPVKLIIAPHEINRLHLDKLRSQFIGSALFYSEALPGNVEEARILIIDNVGMLSSLYKYGKVAYIGGGFGKGIHNILEAATCHIPVLFGPNYSKFEEANELVARGGAFAVSSVTDLELLVNRFIREPEYLQSAGAIAGSYVEENTGATGKVLGILGKQLTGELVT